MSQKTSKYRVNPKDIIERLKERGIYTPDFSIIRKHQLTPVVIYMPELLNNRAGSDILMPKESHYLGKAWSVHSNYILKETAEDLPSQRRYVLFDAPTDKGKLPSPLKGCYLVGECFALSQRGILNLDRYVGNNEFYHREQRSFFLHDQESPLVSGHAPSLKCHVHIGFDAYWNTMTLNKRIPVKDSVRNKYHWML